MADVKASRTGTIGPFDLDRELGRGGMGVVYLARERSSGREVALKVLAPHLAKDERFVKRFMREARAAGELSHPNLVHCHGMGRHHDLYYLVLEYVEGKTLAEVLRERRRLQPRVALEAVRQAAEALGEAHRHGIVHRDVKPHNLMVDMSGRVRVMDFGLAKVQGGVAAATAGSPQRDNPTVAPHGKPHDKTLDPAETEDDAMFVTAAGARLGTPLYMAPEQCTGAPVDGRTDIYALGVTLYELLTGAPPWDPHQQPRLLLQVVTHTPFPPLIVTEPGAPAQLGELVARMTAKNPQDRYGSMEAVCRDIEACLAGKHELAPMDWILASRSPGVSRRPGLSERPQPDRPHETTPGKDIWVELFKPLARAPEAVNQAAPRRSNRRLRHLVLATLVLLASVQAARFFIGGPQRTVLFKDPNLEQAVRESLGIPAGERITRARLEDLTRIEANGRGIRSLEGIQYCVNLAEVELKNNSIQDVARLQGLSKLTTLRLDNNLISDIRPLAHLTQLTVLSLDANSVSDLSPLTDLSALTELGLAFNEVESLAKTDVNPFMHMNSLKLLRLAGNRISDLQPLTTLTNLVSLQLGTDWPATRGSTFIPYGENYVEDLSPLRYLVNLESLDLYFNRVRDISALSELSKLRTLRIGMNQIADLQPLTMLSDLSNLDIRLNRVILLQPLAGLRNLSILWCEGNQISDLGPVGGLESLTDLRVACSNRLNPIKNPEAVAGLANLRNLALDACSVTDLGLVGRMPHLESLCLDHNQIMDLAPLTDKTEMKQLYLQHNAISDISPLRALTLLEDLRLGHNNVMDIGPLAGLTKLRMLFLEENTVNDIGPLSGMTELETLHAYANRISDIHPLADKTALCWLYLYHNAIRDISPLSTLTALQDLRLGANQIEDIKPLSDLVSLKRLFLEQNCVSDVSALTELTGIEELNLFQNRIWSLEPLRGMTLLTQLRASDNFVVDLTPLAGLTNLKVLLLERNLVSSLLPLVQNPGFGGGAELAVRECPLDRDAVLQQIPVLETRHVTIEHGEFASDRLTGAKPEATCSGGGSYRLGTPVILKANVQDCKGSTWVRYWWREGGTILREGQVGTVDDAGASRMVELPECVITTLAEGDHTILLTLSNWESTVDLVAAHVVVSGQG